MIGKSLGPYEIVSPIGSGGMGEVYKARDARMNREVAVKLLPAGWTTNADRLRRFEQESRAAGSLNHPNLVTIYDVGADNGAPYIVMELLEGQTLRDRLDDGAVPPRKAIEHAVQLAHGLAAAHEKGIVHRDLKPENIFLTRDGRLKILDFGLAKLTAPLELTGSATEQATQQRGTSPGVVMGTAGYMSPEQVRGEDVDYRTDIFSFGAILYEMLSGRRAFHGKSAADTMSAILREDPPEIQTSPGTASPALSHIIRHCLEKNREERFQSARDLAFDLQTISGISSPSAPRNAQDATRWRPWMGGAIAAAVLAATGFVAYRAGRNVAPSGAAIPPAIQTSQLTFRAGVESFPSIAPDGKTFVFVSKAAGNDDIYLQRVGGQNAINLTKESLADDTQPAFSADGTRIVFRSERDGGGLFVMGATGESARRISDFCFNPSWSPDGKRIVCGTEAVTFAPQARGTNSELWIIDVASGEKRLLTKENRGALPSWSPSGLRIAFYGLFSAGQRDIYTIAADSPGKPEAVLSDAPLDWNPQWSRDGKWLYFGSDRAGTMGLWRVPIDEQTGRRLGDPEPLPLPARFAAHFTIAHDDRRILFSALEMASAIRRAPLAEATRNASTLFRGSMLIFTFEFSPDGQGIAFSSSGLQEDLYIARVDGTELRQLTNDPDRDRAPSWMPDGKQLVFYSQRSGAYEIWRINADGSGLTQLTEKVTDSLWFPRVSPDGTRMTCISFADSYIIALGAGVARTGEVIPSPSTDDALRFLPTSWSPDGRKVAGISTRRIDREPQGGVFIYDIATKTFTKARDTGARVRWLPDGRTLVIQDGPALVVTDLVTKATRQYPFPQHSAVVAKWADPLWTDGKTASWVEQLNEADVWMATLKAEGGGRKAEVRP